MFRPRHFLVSLCLGISLGFGVLSSQPVVLAQTSPTSGPLVSPAGLVYQGAFCLPDVGAGNPGTNGHTFHDGGHAIAFDPYQNNLIVMGNYRFGDAVRVTVPTPSKTSCPRASVVGPWLDMQWRYAPHGDDWQIGGFLPLPNGDMIVSWYIYYDATAGQTTSHVRRLADGTITTKAQVSGTNLHAGMVSGWMFTVPTEWQALMGGPAMTGNGALSITTRTSQGPSASVFDPADIGRGPTFPATMVLGYPYQHPTLGTCETGRIWNCGAVNSTAGLTWIHGTRTLLYAHNLCAGDPGYPGGGFTCPTGRITRFLLYDANDLLAVKTGQKQPWEVLPYANFDPGPPLKGKIPIGETQDPTTGRVFIVEQSGDGAQPKIHVYEVDLAASMTPTFPFGSKTQDEPSVGLRRTASGAGETSRRAVARFLEGEESEREREKGETGSGPDAERAADSPPRTLRSRQPLAGARARAGPPVKASVSKVAARRQAGAPPIIVCAGNNPFPNRDGWIGVCANGEWTLVRGVRTLGVLREGPLTTNGRVWLIETAEVTYELADDLELSYLTDGLGVIFEGRFTSASPRALRGGVVIELDQISVVVP